MINPWIFETNKQGFDFCRSILVELISRFPLTQSEGIDLINFRWKDTSLIDEYEIVYHESPEYWAKCFYWGKDEVWWNPEQERTLMKLDPLKPKRNEKKVEYELWENKESEEYVFIDSTEVNELMKNKLIDNSFSRRWSTTKQNYIEGL